MWCNIAKPPVLKFSRNLKTHKRYCGSPLLTTLETMVPWVTPWSDLPVMKSGPEAEDLKLTLISNTNFEYEFGLQVVIFFRLTKHHDADGNLPYDGSFMKFGFIIIELKLTPFFNNFSIDLKEVIILYFKLLKEQTEVFHMKIVYEVYFKSRWIRVYIRSQVSALNLRVSVTEDISL